MLVLLVLSVCLAAKAEEFNQVYDLLGRAIYLPNYNLLGSLDETGTPFFYVEVVENCSVVKLDPVSSRSFNYFKDTKSLYSSLTSSAGLDASLQADYSLSFTLDSVSRSISGLNHTVTGNSLLITASTQKTMLDKSCMFNPKFLDKNFMSDFAKLPTKIQAPWLSASWIPYDIFLKKYGSHVVTSITLGSMLNQMAFADSKESYSERDFQVKSCLALAAPTEIGKLNVSLCGGINQSEISRVTSMTMSDQLVVRGGTTETRNQLMQERTPELITKFMNEANTTKSPIKYGFTSVWDILEATFAGLDRDNLIRAVNLEYYYLGYLNYDCDFLVSGGVVLQQFNLSSTATAMWPQYECSLGPSGCHSDNDCHYKPVGWCSCRGSSCILYKRKTLNTGTEKLVASANTDADWGWQGCKKKLEWVGTECFCLDENHEWKVVWTGDNKDAMYMAHYRKQSSSMPEEKEETKEEL